MTCDTLAIINPASGGGRTRKAWPALSRKMRELGICFDQLDTDAPGAGRSAAEKGIATGYRRLIAVGGDGTVNEIVNAMMTTGAASVELAVIPMGTGKDLGRSLGIPHDLLAAARLLQTGTARKLDVGFIECTGMDKQPCRRYFLNVADVGLGAETAQRVNRTGKNLGGFLSFFYGALVTLILYRQKPVQWTVDGLETRSLDLTIAALGNCRYFGGGMHVAPRARPDDGLLDFIALGRQNKTGILKNLMRVYKGTHLQDSSLVYVQCREVSLMSKEPVLIEADGEVVGYLPARFGIVPGAVSVITGY
ncbi:MAG: diacylglycerol/lipid kinase family protein [Bacillota bacterium]